jgi:L-ribulose-5-phosphate 3-epimerase
MQMIKSRRQFLLHTVIATGGLFAGCSSLESHKSKPLFKISLAEWSLHKELFEKKITNMDFPKISKEEFGIDAIEFVNQFFKDKATDRAYLTELKKRCDDLGVYINLIMIDGEGALGDPDPAARTKAVESHYKWVDAAKFFGCRHIRVNADSKRAGTPQEQQARAADGLSRLSDYGAKQKINIIVENHGGLSSNGEWLAGVMKMVNKPNCGTLPDFGNFSIERGVEYDRYKGVQEMMPFAKAVSAKTHDFDAQGNETHTDYKRMLKIVLDAGYHDYIGIEYEGSKLPEREGIRLSKALLEKLRFELSGV